MKKIIILVLLIGLVILGVVFINKPKKENKPNIITMGCFNYKIDNKDVNIKTDLDKNYELKISNNCKNDYEYIILLSVDKDCKETSLVNVTINETLRNVTYYEKNTTYSVSPGYLDSYILKDDIIKSGETMKYNMKFGLNEPKNDLDWIAEIKVIGLAK